MYNNEFGSYYFAIIDQLGDVLRLAITDCYENKEDYWEDVYSLNADKKINPNCHFFFTNININLLGNSEQLYPDDENYEQLANEIFQKSLEIDIEKRILIFDTISLVNQLTSKNDVIINRFHERYQRKPYFQALKDFREFRNAAVGHINEFTKEKYYCSKRFQEFVEIAKKVLSFCKSKYNISEELKKEYKNFNDLCSAYSEKAGYPIIDAKEFVAKWWDGFPIDELITCCKNNNIKYENKDDTIHIYSISEESLLESLKNYNALKNMDKISQKVQDIINIIEPKNPLKHSQNSSVQKVEAKTSEKEKKMSSKTSHKLKNLVSLVNYKGGYLSEEQEKEIFGNYNLLVDSTALLNKESRNYILSTAVTLRSNYTEKSHPLYMHRQSRNQVYQLANADLSLYDNDSEEYKYKKELQKTAKKAYLAIKDLQKRHLLSVYGMPSFDQSETDLLIESLEEKAYKRFCLFTEDKDNADALNGKNWLTTCALKIIRDHAIVWSMFIPNFKANQQQFTDSFLTKGDSNKTVVTVQKSSFSKTTQQDVEKAKSVHNESTVKPLSDASKREKKTKETINTKQNEIKNPVKTSIVVPSPKEIATGDTVFTDNKTNYILGSELARGGEGAIFLLKNQPDKVAKIYFPKRRTDARFQKLKRMVVKKPKSPNIAWAQKILYDENGCYLGFLMQKTPEKCMQLGETVLRVGNQKIAETFLNGWNRKDLIKVSMSICNTFNFLHNNNIFMGDINPANILIDPSDSTKVYFVDCDSYQFENFLCPVGTPIFTSPNFYKRTKGKANYSKTKREKSDEYYAIASLLFQILMGGCPPFISKGTKTEIIKDICDHRFAFKTNKDSGFDAPDGPYRLIWNNMPFNIKNMFARIFKDGVTAYPPGVWRKELDKYLKGIESGEYSDEIFPKKYYDPHNNFVDFTCSICGQEKNMHKDDFNNRLREQEERNYPELILFCNDCKQLLRQEIGEKANCDYCNKLFSLTYNDYWWKHHQGRKYKCPSCKKNRTNLWR